MIRSLILLAAFALATGVVSAAPAATVDPAHTSATFSVRHLTITTVSGKIGLKSVKVDLSDANVPTSVDAVFDLSTIDTQESDRDADLRSEHWFEIAKYPEMTFKSTKVVPGANNAFEIDGDLSFHGATNPVTLTGTYNGSIKDQRGRTHLGYTATATVDRTKWNLGPNFPPAIVGNDITITIQLEAIEAAPAS